MTQFQYCQIIKDLIFKGYVEEANGAQSKASECRKWFLLYHPVLNPNKPSKVHIVMDAAARYQSLTK